MFATGSDILFSVAVISDVVNKNFQLFLKELMPILERSLARKFMDVGNSIVKPFTCTQLFPL